MGDLLTVFFFLAPYLIAGWLWALGAMSALLLKSGTVTKWWLGPEASVVTNLCAVRLSQIFVPTGRSKEDQTKSRFSLQPGDRTNGRLHTCAKQSGDLGKRDRAAFTDWEGPETGTLCEPIHSVSKHVLDAVCVSQMVRAPTRNPPKVMVPLVTE